jgi:D-arabinose 1-dehydrogenase-like Zn-dependent alcohol dehydrogenase
MGWLGFRGKLVCLGVPEGEVKPIAGALVGPMIGNEGTVFAIKSGNRLEAKEALDIVAAGHVTTHYELRKMDELTQVSLASLNYHEYLLMPTDLRRDARWQASRSRGDRP